MTHIIKNEFLRVEAAEHGAELQSIQVANGGEYLGQGDPAYWPDQAPNLFPYVARLTDESYYLDGELHHMKIHGFAPYQDFTLREKAEERLVLELVYNDETLAAYPRHFAFRVIYELRGNTLVITYEVENRDGRIMYFGLGAHPGFRVPFQSGKCFEDYRLRFDPSCQPVRVGFTEDCFLDGTDTPFSLDKANCLLLAHDLFDQDAIVLKNAGHKVTLEHKEGGHSITIKFPQMDYLGLWHWPKTDALYLCIEPWCSLPSTKGEVAAFEEQADLISLIANRIYRNTWSIKISP